MSSSKGKAPAGSNANGGSGTVRTGIPTLRSLRTLFAPTSSQQTQQSKSPTNLKVPPQVTQSTKKSSSGSLPARPSLNLPSGSRSSLNSTPTTSHQSLTLPLTARGSLNSLNPEANGSDFRASASDIVRRSMSSVTLGRKSGKDGSERRTRSGSTGRRRKSQEIGDRQEILDIKPDVESSLDSLQPLSKFSSLSQPYSYALSSYSSPSNPDHDTSFESVPVQDLSTIVEADTSGISNVSGVHNLSLAESLSKHLPELPTDSDSHPSRSMTQSPSLSPSSSSATVPPSPLRAVYPSANLTAASDSSSAFGSSSILPSRSSSHSPLPPPSRSSSASASSLHLPRSPSSINAQVRSALQVDPTLAKLLSPNRFASSQRSETSMAGEDDSISSPPSPSFGISDDTSFFPNPSPPTSNSMNAFSSIHTHPQHASTPHSSLRVKKLGLTRPSYIRDPASLDDLPSMYRPGGLALWSGLENLGNSEASTSNSKPGPSRPGSSMATYTSLHSTLPRSMGRTRTRSLSVDEGYPTATSLGRDVRRRDPENFIRRQQRSSHARSLSHFSSSLSHEGSIQPNARPSSTKEAGRARPHISEWLGPRTAKAFKAAGLLENTSPTTLANDNDVYFDPSASPGSPSLNVSFSASAPSSPVRARYSHTRTLPSYPDSPGNESPSPTYAHYPRHLQTPLPRSVSARSSSVLSGSFRSTGGGSTGFGRSVSALSGSVRSVSGATSARSGSLGSLGSLGRSASGSVHSTASTAPTSLSTSAQATKDYLHLKQSQAQTQSSSTVNLPNASVSSPSVLGASVDGITATSEIQFLKEQHYNETSALLAALSDAQRTVKILRDENAQLRKELGALEGERVEWEVKLEEAERERQELKQENTQLTDVLAEAEGENTQLREALLELEGEKKTWTRDKIKLEYRSKQLQSRLKETENYLYVAGKEKEKIQREKETIEGESEVRAEKALRRIEQLEEALNEASGALGVVLDEQQTIENLDPTGDYRALDETLQDMLMTNENYSPTLSSASSSRPPSIFPLPPENMSLLMNEVTDEGDKSATSFSDPEHVLHIEEDSVGRKELLASGNNWRRAMGKLYRSKAISSQPSTASMSSGQNDPNSHSHHTPRRQASLSLSEVQSPSPDHDVRPFSSFDFEYDEHIGNATFYHADPDDSIISDSDDSLGLEVEDLDPTVHASIAFGGNTNLSISMKASAPNRLATNNEHYDDAASIEGIGSPGTPGSPRSLLWMHPSDERHLVDLED
ncbi:hypothetical protein D9757_003011 [Collybiopsis confluens]|uniref:Uncharacterized protein n=1 Tax=Collybiopsis confluens TaxID=2823264 RepID=A0A8H5MEU1_9AGAR|nr:hypothetical protein D9757_003011 [Collybiopsis confluens]